MTTMPTWLAASLAAAGLAALLVVGAVLLVIARIVLAAINAQYRWLPPKPPVAPKSPAAVAPVPVPAAMTTSAGSPAAGTVSPHKIGRAASG